MTMPLGGLHPRRLLESLGESIPFTVITTATVAGSYSHCPSKLRERKECGYLTVATV